MASGHMEVTGEMKELSQLRMVQGLTEGFHRVWEGSNSEYRQLFQGIMPQGNQKYMGKQVVKSGSIFFFFYA